MPKDIQTDMPASTDRVSSSSSDITVEYALQDIFHKFEAIVEIKHVSNIMWFVQGEHTAKDTSLYVHQATQ